MSYTDLGKATGLSTSAVHQRVKRLEERGLILGYGATIDHAAAGKPLTAFVTITPFDISRPTTTPSGWRRSARSSRAGRSPGRSPTSSRCGWRLPPTSRSCWPGSGRRPTSRRGPRSCSPPPTRTGRRTELDADDAAMSGDVLAVFLAVVGARFLLPLFIPRYPLPAIIALPGPRRGRPDDLPGVRLRPARLPELRQGDGRLLPGDRLPGDAAQLGEPARVPDRAGSCTSSGWSGWSPSSSAGSVRCCCSSRTPSSTSSSPTRRCARAGRRCGSRSAGGWRSRP